MQFVNALAGITCYRVDRTCRRPAGLTESDELLLRRLGDGDSMRMEDGRPDGLVDSI